MSKTFPAFLIAIGCVLALVMGQVLRAGYNKRLVAVHADGVAVGNVQGYHDGRVRGCVQATGIFMMACQAEALEQTEEDPVEAAGVCQRVAYAIGQRCIADDVTK